MKKYRFLLLLIASLLIIFSIFYINIYKIESNKEAIQQFLTNLNKDREDYRGAVKEIILWSEIDDTNTRVAKFQFENGDFGSAQFKKGLNQRLKFVSMNNEPHLTYTKIKTNRGVYGIISGINVDNKISKIKIITQNHHDYFISPQKGILFMEYKKLENTEGMDPTKYILYDKEDNVIETY